MPGGGHFVGDFNADFRPHGEGVEYRADGSQAASGQWRDGKLHRRGKQLFSSGDRYEGEFVDGKFGGLGSFTWTTGAVYEGAWADGKRSGLGALWGKDAKLLYCGRWENDQPVEHRRAPLVKFPVGAFLSASGQQREAA